MRRVAHDASLVTGGGMKTYEVSFLDVMARNVREAIADAGGPEFRVTFADSPDAEAQMKLLPGADFIITGTQPMTKAMFAAAPRLRLVQKWGIGVDKIDLEAARRAGVPVTITFGANAGPVSELAVGLMLAVYRKLPLVDAKLRQGVWLKSEMRSVCYQISGKRVGLFGFGNIGRTVAHRLRGFDADVTYFDLKRADPPTEKGLRARYVPFDELIAKSDILSVHVPLDASTRHAIDGRVLERMKDGAILVNTARGGIVDEKALYQALVAGKLRGAGLDVFEKEPPAPDNPLLCLEQVALSPHIGGGVFDNVDYVARRAFGNMRAILEGRSPAEEDTVVPPSAKPAAAAA
jgi:D-3-phosphoglycerate dehydrogenase